MLAMLSLAAALVAVCFLIGQGALALCGATSWRWWAPAVGYAVLLVVGGQVVRLPNHQAELAAAIVLAAIGAAAVPLVRRAVVEAAPDALPIGVGVILLAAIPFFAIGRTGVLGASWSDDMSQHLTAAFYLGTGAGLRPAAAVGGNLISTGYPLGAQGLAALLTRLSGLGEERVFSAITLAIPVLTGFAALGLVHSARRSARSGFAAIVGLGYLPAAYLAQGSFKDTAEALFVLATAVALDDLAREQPPRGVRRGVPVGLLIGGAVYTYSYGGAGWMIGIAALFLMLAIARHHRQAVSIVRASARPAIGAVLAAAVVVSPETARIQQFAGSGFGFEPTTQHGNLFHAINPLETLGVWLSGDFRINPRPEWPSLALAVICLVALIASVAWWWRRHSLALPAAVLASIAIWVYLALNLNTYNAAKGLVVMAPVVMACFGAPLAAAWGERVRTARSRPGLIAARALGAALLAAAAVSTLGQLRSAPVGLGPHEQELASIRPLVRGKSVLFLASDNFAQWELRGARLYVSSRLYAPAELEPYPQRYKGLPADLDAYDARDLDRVRFLLMPGAAYRSEIPPNFRLIKRTTSYELYRRVGPTPVWRAEPLERPEQSGAVFDCTTPLGQRALAQYSWAGVLPRPVVRADWRGSIGVPGRTATIRLTLAPGRWDVSLQYVSFTGLLVRAPGLRKLIPASYGPIGAYWPAGTLTSDGRPFTLSVMSQNRTWFGRLLGAPRTAYSFDSPGLTPIWHIALTRHGVAVRRVPVRQACGLYVDWFAPAGSTMR